MKQISFLWEANWDSAAICETHRQPSRANDRPFEEAGWASVQRWLENELHSEDWIRSPVFGQSELLGRTGKPDQTLIDRPNRETPNFDEWLTTRKNTKTIRQDRPVRVWKFSEFLQGTPLSNQTVRWSQIASETAGKSPSMSRRALKCSTEFSQMASRAFLNETNHHRNRTSRFDLRWHARPISKPEPYRERRLGPVFWWSAWNGVYKNSLV